MALSDGQKIGPGQLTMPELISMLDRRIEKNGPLTIDRSFIDGVDAGIKRDGDPKEKEMAYDYLTSICRAKSYRGISVLCNKDAKEMLGMELDTWKFIKEFSGMLGGVAVVSAVVLFFVL
ncbi:MAG: hypothetical protein V2A66_09635 [Pseudomonadota bacterium]